MTPANSENSDIPDLERLTDVSDIATSLEMKFTANAIAQAQKKNKQDQLPGPDGKYPETECQACGLEIGEGRLRVAPRNLLCVFCATKEERRKR